MFKIVKNIRLVFAKDLSKSNLQTLLTSLTSESSQTDKMIRFRKIMEWIREPLQLKDTELISTQEFQSRNIRFKFLMQFLENNPEIAKSLIEVLRELTLKGRSIRLYTQTGLSENVGFFHELTNRSIQRFIPDALDEYDLAELFQSVFTQEEDAKWLESSHQLIIPLLQKFFKQHEYHLSGPKLDLYEATIILGSQASTLGLSRAIRRRLRFQSMSDSPFLKLSMCINKEGSSEEVLGEVSAARLSIEDVRADIEGSGVSVDLIYKIEKLGSLLDRIESLVYLRDSISKETSSEFLSFFISRLMRDQVRSLSVQSYFKENLHLLTRKIVERTGEKGDVYIASTPAEKNKLFVAASWAGVLTAFTAIMKYWIGAFHFPLFFEGLFFFLNYALGFLLMQHWHLALSSKQPAFMASALSRKFEAFNKTKELSEISLEIRKISYSQWIASFANLLWVIPMVVALDWAWYYVTGYHMVTTRGAHEIINKHHPLHSLTIGYAIFTGVLLWLSSVVSGWVENWLVFRNIPKLISKHPSVRAVFGKQKARDWAHHLAPTIGGIAANLSIAFFLASPIIIGKITGIPLDIRHVTLAAGTLTLAVNALPWDASIIPVVILVMSSIVLIGIMNFTVSFFFAIRMAAMARQVDPRHLRIIFKYALRKPKATPL
jgi:site-specific recombinase